MLVAFGVSQSMTKNRATVVKTVCSTLLCPLKAPRLMFLADRFQTWRKFLKDLIAYFREVSSSYEHRAKSLLKVSNVINNTNAPASLLSDGGLNEANRFLRDFHKQAIAEANKARDIEADVINQLSGLRADLAQKIKEIKSLSGDFKNNVEKEKEGTRKAVTALEEALAVVDSDPSAIAGKGDPYVVRLGVERQVERQIDEENYLHRAYLNLENSGRELESIVVGEIQKAYNALASILKRDADGCIPQSRSFVAVRSLCLEIRSGTVLFGAMLTSSTLTCPCADWKKSSTLESITLLQQKSGQVCLRGRASI